MSLENIQRKVIMVSLIFMCYMIWIVAEQAVLANPLYALSRQHIKLYREFLHKHPNLEMLSTFVSEFGDKGGLGFYLALSYSFQNQAHAFMTGLQICIIPAFS